VSAERDAGPRGSAGNGFRGATAQLQIKRRRPQPARALSELAGVPALVDRAGLMDMPQERVAVIDGTALAPGQPWKRGSQTIKTIWGELVWQLGGAEAFALVAEADATGASPGKDALRTLL
jgi:predicted AAA+ superfamily ATPase